MKLTANPFDPTTGDLLPVYRDAYLRGDLSAENARLVDAHLNRHSDLGTQTWQRFHSMEQTGEQVQAVGWMQRQINQVRTAPQRVRRQVTTLVALAALAGGAVFAGTSSPTAPAEGGAAEAASTTMRMTTLRGKILDENGHPLVGATVLEKGSHRGVSTNADGEYAFAVPVGRAVTISYDYAGYTGEEIQLAGKSSHNVTLVPSDEAPAKRTHAARRWLFFKR